MLDMLDQCTTVMGWSPRICWAVLDMQDFWQFIVRVIDEHLCTEYLGAEVRS